jgi:hypothetical protein
VAEKTAKYQLVVAIILALVTIGNVIFTVASQPSTEIKHRVDLHDSEIRDLQLGRVENKTNIENLQKSIVNLDTNNQSDHQRMYDKLEAVWKAVK